MLVLKTLTVQPMHGYGIAQELQRRSHDVIQTRLIDGQCIGIPRGDPPGVHINHTHFDVRRLTRDHGHRWPADIPRSDTTDFHVLISLY